MSCIYRYTTYIYSYNGYKNIHYSEYMYIMNIIYRINTYINKISQHNALR